MKFKIGDVVKSTLTDGIKVGIVVGFYGSDRVLIRLVKGGAFWDDLKRPMIMNPKYLILYPECLDDV